jgi:drug/metabolite transporter (DMT)-like permease
MKQQETVGLICLSAVYLLWGSTFLGIRLAVETIPPLIAGLARHGFGGLVLALVLFLLGRWVKPNWKEKKNALIVGALTAGISNGALMWAEVQVPSAYAAITFTTMPLFLLLFNWIGFEKVIPSIFDFIALPLGLVGCALVLLGGESLSGGHVGFFDAFLLVLCPSVWALGSLLGRRWELPKNILVSSALQMLGGALLLLLLSVFHGDWFSFKIESVSQRSFWGLLYLAVGGSLIGYTAFATAIRNLDSRIVGTYAFINPIVAVALGFFFGEEIWKMPIILGSLLSISAVALTFTGARYRIAKAN